VKKNLFIILFAVSVAGVFAGILLHLKWLDYLCKPLIMISIGGYFLQNSKKIDKKTVRFALIAFLFSLFGDIFLMFTGEGMMFFMLGLGSFLVAQIGYIFLFRHTLKLFGNQSYIRKNPLLLIGYLVFGGIVYYLLFNQLDIVLKIVVLVYMLALLGMSAMALNRFKSVSSVSFYLVFAGSVLFVISDTLIALDKFFSPIPNDRLLVMSTYIAAQFLIMMGILKQFEKHSLRFL
jgi:uncharacterized membrane protein YhhN